MTVGHRYLSTACHHDQHDYCAAPRRPDGTPKQPASCKFCSAPCECVCHKERTPRMAGQESADSIFTPQPYPLFIAQWNGGQPLTGRIVGWEHPRGVHPSPVVVWHELGNGGHAPAVVSDLWTASTRDRFWIGDTVAEVQGLADRYRAAGGRT